MLVSTRYGLWLLLTTIILGQAVYQPINNQAAQIIIAALYIMGTVYMWRAK